MTSLNNMHEISQNLEHFDIVFGHLDSDIEVKY